LCGSLFNRKGASEIIAAMLLIVITVAAAVLMYAYASGLMGGLQGVAVKQPYLEHLALDYYDWTGGTSCGTGKLCLSLRNVGSASITIKTADYFVNGIETATPSFSCASGALDSNGNLVPQGFCQVTVPMPTGFTPTPGVAYSVKIATKDGAIFSYSCIAGRAS